MPLLQLGIDSGYPFFLCQLPSAVCIAGEPLASDIHIKAMRYPMPSGSYWMELFPINEVVGPTD